MLPEGCGNTDNVINLTLMLFYTKQKHILEIILIFGTNKVLSLKHSQYLVNIF